MIRLWPFAEAPGVFVDMLGIGGIPAGRTPVWLAHQMDSSPASEDLLRELYTAWRMAANHEVHHKDVGASGILTVGTRG